jgi:hypothetical protein
MGRWHAHAASDAFPAPRPALAWRSTSVPRQHEAAAHYSSSAVNHSRHGHTPGAVADMFDYDNKVGLRPFWCSGMGYSTNLMVEARNRL